MAWKRSVAASVGSVLVAAVCGGEPWGVAGGVIRGQGRTQAPARDRQTEKTGSARIGGRVAAADGMPLRRAQVRLFAADSGASRLATTDAQGRYECSGLPAGRYTAIASKPGYVSMTFGAVRPSEGGRPIDLGDREQFDKGDFTLSRGGVIAGRLEDESGEPVMDAIITAIRFQTVAGQRRAVPSGRSVQTNDLGEFRLYGVSPGKYFVSASVRPATIDEPEDRSGYAPTYFPGTSTLAEATPVPVKAAQEASGINFPLVAARMSHVSGVVIEQRRSPVVAHVMLRPRVSDGFASVLGVPVRPDGSFVIANVPPGDYTLTALGGDALFASVPIALSGGDVEGVALTLGRGATGRGRVVFDPAAAPSFVASAVRVSTVPPSEVIQGPVQLHDDWSFELTGLSGTRVLRVSGLPPEWIMKTVLLGGEDVTDRGVEFKGTDTVHDLQIVLTNRVSEVSGTVTDAQGRPVIDCHVVAFAEDSGKWRYMTRSVKVGGVDQSGAFSIRGLPADTYLLVAIPANLPADELDDPELLEQVRSRGVRVTLGEGETRAVQLKVTMVAGSSLPRPE